MKVRTDPAHPPLGVADELLREAAPSSYDRFVFWVLAHEPALALFWPTAVMRECLPKPEDLSTLVIEAGEFLR